MIVLIGLFLIPLGSIAQACNAEISGRVYNDYNFNASFDGTETGISNFLVLLFQKDSLLQSQFIDSVRTDILGLYTFSNVAQGNYRLEFIPGLSLSNYQGQFIGSKDLVRFVDESSCDEDLPIVIPAHYCQDNPEVFTPCFVAGDDDNVVANPTTLLGAPYNSSGNSISISTYANNSEIGSVWGLGYDSYRNKLYSSAFVKRHVGLGEDISGKVLPGAIYETDPLTKMSKLFLNLTDYGIDPGVIAENTGINSRNLPTNGASRSIDDEAFFKTGKLSLGDLDVDPCDTFLYAMNLYDKTVYKFSTLNKVLCGKYPVPQNLCDVFTDFRLSTASDGYVGTDGRQWFAQGFFLEDYPRIHFGNQAITNTLNNGEGTADEELYQHAMISPQIFFKIPMQNGLYEVKFHFVEHISNLRRKIDVIAEDILVLDDYQTSNAQWEARAITVSGIQVNDGVLDLEFIAAYNASLPSVSISGIEVIPKESQLFCESRPFGIAVDRGNLYVGMVCASEYTQDTSKLKAFVLHWDKNSQQFIPILDFKLNYQKGLVALPNCAAGYPCGDIRGWFPWATTFPFNILGPHQCETIYPQPILSDIEVDDDGSLILAFMDRAGNQMGPNNFDLVGNTNGPIAISAGEILRVCNTFDGLKLEGTHPQCPSNSLNLEGPGGGEFYHGDSTYLGEYCHSESGFGSLVLKHGTNEILMSSLDPTDSPLSGGVITLNSIDGSRIDGFRVYTNNFSSINPNFSKANGIGDLALDCVSAPFEIGNSVWLDLNQNGIQDPGEQGIEGVEITLLDSTRAAIGKTITDANGYYVFNSSILSGASLNAYSRYYLVFGTGIDQTDTMRHLLFDSLLLTHANTGVGHGHDLHDSDAKYNASFSDLPTIDFSTNGCGLVDYTLDVGFSLFRNDLALQKILVDPLVPIQIGDRVRFKLKIYNQGLQPVHQYTIADYYNADAYSFDSLALLNLNWKRQNDILIRTDSSSILPGECDSFYLDLKVTSRINAMNEINFAEVFSMQDVYGNIIGDIDSRPGSNSAYERQVVPGSPNDDVVTGKGEIFSEDEDDHDPGSPLLMDIHIEKDIINPMSYRFGDTVCFQIRLINEGNMPSGTIHFCDSIPEGFEFLAMNSTWILNKNIASYHFNQTLFPGDTAKLELKLKVKSVRNNILTQWINYAYIKEIRDTSNNPVKDIDIDDWKSQKEVEIYDLALKYSLDHPVNGLRENDIIKHVIKVYNQGNRKISSYDLSIYLPLPSVFNATFLDNTWYTLTDTVLHRTISDTIRPGDSAFHYVYLTLIPTPDLSKWISYTEISKFLDQYGQMCVHDADSYPDSLNTNDAGGLEDSPNDDFIFGNGTGAYRSAIQDSDEDDHDPQRIPIVDYALILNANQPLTHAGNTLCFTIKVYNQNSSALRSFDVSMYYPLNFGSIDPAWTFIGKKNNVNIASKQFSIANGLLPLSGLSLNDSIELQVCFDTYQNLPGGMYSLYAELSKTIDLNNNDVSGNDIDSKPDQIYDNDGGARLYGNSDNATGGKSGGLLGDDDPNLDEDDHDVAGICIQNALVLAGPKNVCYLSTTQYTIQSYNPGNIYKWSVIGNGQIIGPDNARIVNIEWTGVIGSTSMIMLEEFSIQNCNNSVQYLVTVVPQISLACDNLIRVSLNDMCFAKIDADMVLEGNDYAMGFATIELRDKAGNIIPGSTVTTDHIGDTLIATVRASCNGFSNSCWGKIIVEDKLPPKLLCKNYLVECTDNIDSPFEGIHGYLPFPSGTVYTILSKQSFLLFPSQVDCQEVVLSYFDIRTSYACSENSLFQGRLIRTWTAIDKSGNTYTCNDTFWIKRLGIADISLPESYDGIMKPILECGGVWDKNGDGYPQVVELDLPVQLKCSNFAYTYKDFIVPICNGPASKKTSFKVLRTWTYIDWCTGNILEHIQLIKVLDTQGPELAGPTDIVIYVAENSCTAVLSGLKPDVIYDCSNYTYELKSSAGLIVGYSIFNLPITESIPHVISIVVTDDCGNISTQRLNVFVQDKTPPLAICDQTTVVSLNNFGSADLYATSINNKSIDNCTVEKILIRRVDTYCVKSDLEFSDHVTFCCSDLSASHKVVMRVIDKSNNYNDCEVFVRVSHKLAPDIHCPPNITIDCHQNYLDLNLTGAVQYTSICHAVDTFIDQLQLNSCGVGRVTRTWIVSDNNGLSSRCDQIIVIEDELPFSGQITWPQDATFNGCRADLRIEDTGKPTFMNTYCSLIAATYDDQIFYNTDSSCIKIVRNWSVIDWCNYKPNESGLYNHIQLIRLFDSKPPDIFTCDEQIVIANDSCNAKFVIDIIADDDCTDSLALHYRWKIIIGGDPFQVLEGTKNIEEVILPIGKHIVFYYVEDQCGNLSSCTFNVMVEDQLPPKLYCNSGLVTVLMSPSGAVDVSVRDFIISTDELCSQPVYYSFDSIRVVEKLTFTCKDIPDGISQTIALDVWVWDNLRNRTKCTVTLQLQDNSSDVCQDRTTITSISGEIRTITDRRIPNAILSIDTMNGNSDHTGHYSFNVSNLVHDQLKVIKEDQDITGISTFDIIMIQKHILGTEVFKNPYQCIAADVTKNKSITAGDILYLRKLILGEYQPADVWRFVVEDKNLSVENSFAFKEQFQVVKNSTNSVNFVGLKIGDVSDDAILASTGNLSSRNHTNILFYYSYSYETGMYTFYSGQEFSMDGFQLSILLPQNQKPLELIPNGIDIRPGNFYIDNEKVRISYHNIVPVIIKKGQALFQIKIHSTMTEEDCFISQETPFLNEVYDQMNVSRIILERRNGNDQVLDQPAHSVLPNPAFQNSVIRFEIRSNVDDRYIIRIWDLKSKEVYKDTKYLIKGSNSWIIDQQMDWTPGIYSYIISNQKIQMKGRICILPSQ